MTEIFTRARIPGSVGHIGFMDNGRRTRQHMIARMRKWAEQQKREAETVLAAPDDAFKVTVVRGCHVQHLIEELKP